ncbi:MAG: hypothetical protein Q7V17_09740 [Afipia sp.]|nr:hypothetical protein [Afipia sp.]
MTAYRLIASLAAATFVMHAADVRAQGAFPAPLPGQAAPPPASNASPFPPVNNAASPFPPVNGATAAPVRQQPSSNAFSAGAPPVGGGGFGAPQQQAGPPPGAEECQKGFLPLRADAEAKAKLIQAAGKRKAAPQEACKLIANFAQAETKMIKFVDANAQKCGIPAQVSDQMKKGHANTSQLQQRVCAAASQAQAGPAGPSLSEALGSASLPEAKPLKRGGSTFDTLNGNVLTR